VPSTALFEITIEDRHDSTPELLHKAISFIDDNAHRDISVTDIAESIHVTPRAVQYMFRTHLDCTPTDYLRGVRLHYAHLDLVAGSHMTTTVGQIATKWGFGHLGRFAVYYRQRYGQGPHVTLRS
jgi:transcriptional regulator GlxA family with amidase domain